MDFRNKISFTRTQIECLLLTILSAVYYILNMVFPYTENIEFQQTARIYPQIAGAIVVCFCMAIIIVNIRLIIRNNYLLLFLSLLSLALIYVVFPFKPIDNLKYVSRVYFGIFYLLALFVLLRKDRKSALKAIFTIYFFQLLFCLFSLLYDRVIYEMGLSYIAQFNSNSGFLITCCIPLSLIIPRKRLRVYLYFLLVVASFFSGQRSAALVALISVPFCLPHLWKSIRKVDIVLLVALSLAATPIMIKSIDNIVERNAYDTDRGDDVGSGRSTFWKITWDSYKEKSIENIIFGNGTNSVAPVLEAKYGLSIGAHNGWLDILYTFGIVGLLLYALIVFGMFFRNRFFAVKGHPYKNFYLILFIIFIVKCTTSHGYFDVNVAPFCAMIAILESSKKFVRSRHAES